MDAADAEEECRRPRVESRRGMLPMPEPQFEATEATGVTAAAFREPRVAAASHTAKGGASGCMDHIPSEMIDHILAYLSDEERLRVGATCKRWQKINDDCFRFRETIRDTYHLCEDYDRQNRFKDSFLGFLSRHGSKVRRLELCDKTRSRGGLVRIAEMCGKVEWVRLIKQSLSTMECAERWTRLVSLEVKGGVVSGSTLEAFLKRCPSLQRLCVSGVQNAISLGDGAAVRSNLRTLALDNLPLLTSLHIQPRSGLKILNTLGCPLMPAEDVASLLRASCNTLERLHLHNSNLSPHNFVNELALCGFLEVACFSGNAARDETLRTLVASSCRTKLREVYFLSADVSSACFGLLDDCPFLEKVIITNNRKLFSSNEGEDHRNIFTETAILNCMRKHECLVSLDLSPFGWETTLDDLSARTSSVGFKFDATSYITSTLARHMGLNIKLFGEWRRNR